MAEKSKKQGDISQVVYMLHGNHHGFHLAEYLYSPEQLQRLLGKL